MNILIYESAYAAHNSHKTLLQCKQKNWSQELLLLP